MKYPVYAWSVSEQLPILESIFREVGVADHLVRSLCEQTFARALEDVFIIDCSSFLAVDPMAEALTTHARKKYLRCEGEVNYTLEQDVGHLLHKINSSNIPFECAVLLRRDSVLFFERTCAREVLQAIGSD